MKQLMHKILLFFINCVYFVCAFTFSLTTQAIEPTSKNELRVIISNSAAQTGIIQELIRQYELINPGSKIKLSQHGSLAVINRARAGEADFIITHHPEGEQFLLDSGVSLQRTLIMYNTFVIFGPVGDPLQLSTKPDIEAVLQTLAENEVDMLLPSNRSGTYKKLDSLWQRAGITPDWIGYEITGSSNVYTLRTADTMNAYTFVDIGTYISLKKELSGLNTVLFRDDASLRNYYSGNIINSEIIKGVNEKEAKKFLEFLINNKTQDLISDFSLNKFGTDIFTPAAHLDSGLRSTKIEKALLLKSENYQRLAYLFSALLIFFILVLILGARLYINSHKRKISEQRYALAVEGSNDGIWDWDIIKNNIFISDRALEIIDLKRNITHNLSLEEILSHSINPNEKETVISRLKTYITDGVDSNRFEIQFSLTSTDIAKDWVLLRSKKIIDHEGKAIRLSGSVTNITDSVNILEWKQKALHDELTGLGNRLLLSNRAADALYKAEMRGATFSLLMLDLSKFKEINDNLGHDSGDTILVDVARRLETVARQSDTVVRLGGDEFVLLLEGVDKSRAINITEKILESMSKPFVLNNREVSVGANIGIAVYPEHSKSFDALLNMADQAMYVAKRKHDCYAVYSASHGDLHASDIDQSESRDSNNGTN